MEVTARPNRRGRSKLLARSRKQKEMQSSRPKKNQVQVWCLADTNRGCVCKNILQSAVSVLVDDQFDTTPTFIKSLSEEKHKGFDDIWMNTEISDTEKHKKLRDYAKENFNDEQKAGFEEWITGVCLTFW
ncbi:hypothetical protein ANCDUO_05533 [Ancylostoma duodenale]|uniref:Uncharacterized protein n=1 Tax=Ancylostoma duodenale TaxID=51022 RepID=A0A0C2GS67_9BILA|nr:hypothetical protein ANCDUO_05533 [Ancylostoma duodenale]